MTTALSVIVQRVSEANSDYISVSTSTNITTNNYVFSTSLNSYDGAQDDAFNNWWVYIDGVTNVGVERKVKDYTTSGGRLEVYGAALVAETAARTVEVSRYRRSDKVLAINRGIEHIYPSVHINLDDITLVTGNILPDGHFEWWTSSTASKFYSLTNATVAQTTTAGQYRGQRGRTSAKVTATTAAGYMYLHSDSYPRLLDLMGQSVTFKCWALPEVANDASIVIYTKKADGTAQTLTSTTANPIGEFTELLLENQTLNDDLVEVSVRFPIATINKYVCFDDARLYGISLDEILLPYDFQNGSLNSVRFCDSDEDIQPSFGRDVMEDCTIIDDGTYKYLHSGHLLNSQLRIRLGGYKPLETLSAATDTISTDDSGHIQMIVAYALHQLYEMQGGVSSQDKGRFQMGSAYWLGKYNRLGHHRMATINRQLRST